MPFPLSDASRRAIEHHFRKRAFFWNEKYFLSVIANSAKKHDAYWSAIGLREVGTQESLNVLQGLLTHPMKDVKCVAALTLAHVGRSQATEILGAALLDPKYPEKAYAMWAINDAADVRAVPSVVKYFVKNRSKIRRGELTNGTIVEGIQFLSKYSSSSEDARDFLAEFRSLFSCIAEGERSELTKRLPDLTQRFAGDA